MSLITIKYTCPKCGIADQELDVPERQRAVDVVCWMSGPVAKRLAQDHAEKRPLCRWDTFELTIPVMYDATTLGRTSE